MPSDTAVVLPSSGSDDAAQQGKFGWRGGGRWRPLWHGGGYINVSVNQWWWWWWWFGRGGILFTLTLQGYDISEKEWLCVNREKICKRECLIVMHFMFVFEKLLWLFDSISKKIIFLTS